MKQYYDDQENTTALAQRYPKNIGLLMDLNV